MARYLKSLSTGVILPYVAASLKSPGVREATSEEATEYEASLGIVNTAKPASKPKAKAKVSKKTRKKKVVTQDISEGEPDPDEVLAALKVD